MNGSAAPQPVTAVDFIAAPPQRRRPRGREGLVALAAALVAALAAACGSGSSASDGSQAVATSGSLAGACPQRIVVQGAWYPTADVGVPFQVLGPDWKTDPKHKSVSGSLMDGTSNTGVTLEFRSGGPATNFQTAPALAYADKSVTVAVTNIDEILGLSRTQPMTAVVAPLNGDPQVLIWDPATHPEFNNVQDIGQTDTRVLRSPNATTLFGYLTGAGILRASQLDASYDGSPSRFVAAHGRDVVQGYATNEPHLYETLPAWHKPVESALIQDTGYPNYADVLAVRSGDLTRLSGCLRRLVPILQRGLVAFMANPGPALNKIVKANTDFTSASFYDRSAADYAVCQLKALNLVSNPISRVAGGYDTSKLQRMIEILRPVLAEQRQPLRDGLQPGDIATGAYLDPSISLPTSSRLAGVRCTARSTP